MVSFLNGVLPLQRAEEKQAHNASECEPYGKYLVAAVPSPNGPTNQNPRSDYGKPQFGESHDPPSHDYLPLMISASSAARVSEYRHLSNDGTIIPAYSDNLQFDGLRFNCNWAG